MEIWICFTNHFFRKEHAEGLELQNVQNSAGRLVLKAHERDHVSPRLRTVYWLSIKVRIEHKLSTLWHSFFLWHSPSLSFWPSSVHSPSRHLRSSSDSRILRVPHTKTITFSKSFIFPCSYPSVWKSLASEIGDTQSTAAFKTALRTHPFNS